MAVKELGAATRPMLDILLDHQRAGDLAGSADARQRRRDEIEHLARTRLAARHRGQIAHRLRKIARSDEEDVDAFDRKDLVEIVDGLDGLDHADQQSGLEIGGAGMAHRRDHGAGLFSCVDERHHQPIDAGIEIAGEKRALMRIWAQDGAATARARRARHLARLIEARRAVLAIDEDRVRL